MQLYCESLTEYKRLKTREVKIGDLLLGNYHPIRVQTMTTTDTMDTMATVEQSIRCIEAGSELIRITAPSKNEAENLLNIKNELRKRGYTTPLVADIHFTPNAAEIAARQQLLQPVLAAAQKVLKIGGPWPNRLRTVAPRSFRTRAPRAPALILPRHITLLRGARVRLFGWDTRPRLSARLYRGPPGPLQRKLGARSSYA